MPYRAIIVEDEELSRNRLKRMLDKRKTAMEIIGECDNGPDAVTVINRDKPDVLFLDIHLPGMNGFEVVHRLEKQPAIIFTTAYDKHALEAFQTYAIDYLLKPIEEEALDKAIKKLMTLRPQDGDLSHKLEQLMKSLGADYISRVQCKVGDKTYLVNINDVVFFQSNNKYTDVYTCSETFVIDTPLTELEQRLHPKKFVRIHRSAIVNINWIGEYRKWFEGRIKVVMKDNKKSELIASRLYAEKLRDI